MSKVVYPIFNPSNWTVSNTVLSVSGMFGSYVELNATNDLKSNIEPFYFQSGMKIYKSTDSTSLVNFTTDNLQSAVTSIKVNNTPISSRTVIRSGGSGNLYCHTVGNPSLGMITGSNNTLLCSGIGYVANSKSDCTHIGPYIASSNGGGNNTLIGSNCGYSFVSTNQHNTGAGSWCLRDIDPTNGINNTALGSYSGRYGKTDNTSLGRYALTNGNALSDKNTHIGASPTNGTNTTMTNNILLGANLAQYNTLSNKLYIGDDTFRTNNISATCANGSASVLPTFPEKYLSFNLGAQQYKLALYNA